jgi:hypothetical protein
MRMKRIALLLCAVLAAALFGCKTQADKMMDKGSGMSSGPAAQAPQEMPMH